MSARRVVRARALRRSGLDETDARFFDTISLPRPAPEALGMVLAHLDVEPSP